MLFRSYQDQPQDQEYLNALKSARDAKKAEDAKQAELTRSSGAAVSDSAPPSISSQSSVKVPEDPILSQPIGLLDVQKYNTPGVIDTNGWQTDVVG